MDGLQGGKMHSEAILKDLLDNVGILIKNAEEKIKAEQDAQKMEFVLQKEKQDTRSLKFSHRCFERYQVKPPHRLLNP